MKRFIRVYGSGSGSVRHPGCSSEESEESGMESVEDQLFQNLYDKPSKRQAQENYVKKSLEQPPNKNLEEKDFQNDFQ